MGFTFVRHDDSNELDFSRARRKGFDSFAKLSRRAYDRGFCVCGKGSVMELAILLVALVVTLAVCFAALRLLAYEFDCVCGPSANGRQRAQRVRQELVDLS